MLLDLLRSRVFNLKESLFFLQQKLPLNKTMNISIKYKYNSSFKNIRAETYV